MFAEYREAIAALAESSARAQHAETEAADLRSELRQMREKYDKLMERTMDVALVSAGMTPIFDPAVTAQKREPQPAHLSATGISGRARQQSDAAEALRWAIARREEEQRKAG